MLRNYFHVILQNLIRNKTYSLINILGLSVGLAVFMIILQYVRFEQSYDRFRTKADRLTYQNFKAELVSYQPR